MKILVWLAGICIVLFGLGFAGTALMTGSGELQTLFGVFAMAGLLIALAGGALLALGSLLGRGNAKVDRPRLTPEQQQLLDAQEFQATHRE